MRTYKQFKDEQKPALSEEQQLDEVTFTAIYAVNKLRTMVKQVKNSKNVNFKIDKAVEGLAVALGVLNMQWQKNKQQRQ